MKLRACLLLVTFSLTVSGAFPGRSVYEPYSFTEVLYSGPGGLFSPKSSAVDAVGNIYLTDVHKITRITPFGVATIFAGSTTEDGSQDGTGTDARFTNPQGIALDPTTGNLFVADTGNHTIRKITPAAVVTTFAGSPGKIGVADGTGATARFSSPRGVAVDGMGNVYVGDTSNHTIRKITPSGAVTTLAGVATLPGYADGPSSVARFDDPWGLAVDGNGQVFVADNGNHVIRKVTPAGEVSTLAGVAAELGGYQDDQGCPKFSSPQGVAVDSNGNVFVADTANHLIRKIDPAGVVTTLGSKTTKFGSATSDVTLYGTNQILVTAGPNPIIGTPAPQPTPMAHTVTNTNDSGPGSLRQAVNDSQSGDTVNFASSLNGQVIGLTSDQITINADISIIGPGANSLTIERSNGAGTEFRIFQIAPNNTVTISGLTMRKGNAHSSTFDAGGAIYNDQSKLTVDRCMFFNNTAMNGGAICSSGLITASFPRVSTSATLIVSNSTFQSNTAGFAGGAIINGRVPDNTGADTVAYGWVRNCTFRNNAAVGRGGGIDNSRGNDGTAALEVTNSTFSGNFATNGTALACLSGPCSAGNSIFQGTGSGQTVAGSGGISPTFTDRGYNVATDDPTGPNSGAPLFGAASQTNTDPQLGPLQDNGGPTLTQAPLVGSPAIDKGKDLALDACNDPFGDDQRGFPRPVRFNPAIPLPSGGDGSDVGAVELSGPAPTLGNISTRLSVGTGDDVLIGGFIVEGSVSKKVLIRARGPSLSGFVTNPLPNPRLELHDATSTIGNNNDWETTQIGGVITADQRQEIQDSGLAPGDSAESAIIATLPPGNYTAIVQDVNGAIGVGIVEVFDLTPNVSSRLSNISTRGFVQAGDDVMIGGIIVVNQPTRIIVRARGPSLAGGVSNPLPNPQLELHDQSNLIATNDDWQTTQIGGVITADQKQEIQNSGFAPSNSAESAMIVTLQPGTYTAIVRDANGVSGIGIVEVFILP